MEQTCQDVLKTFPSASDVHADVSALIIINCLILRE